MSDAAAAETGGKYRNIQQAHDDLTDGFGQLLSRTSQLPRFVPPRWGRPDRPVFGELASEKLEWIEAKLYAPFLRLAAPNFAIRIAVDFHVRRRATELAARYRQRRLRHSRDDEEYEWLGAKADDFDELAGTLKVGGPIPRLATLVGPSLLGLGVASLGFDNVNEAIVGLYESGELGAYLILPGLLLVYGLLLTVIPFRWKRSLVLGRPGLRLFSTPDRETGTWPNIYLLEDRLFDALEFRKPREFPVDAYALAAVAIANLLLALSLDGSWIVPALYGAGALAALVWGYRRNWR